MSPADSTRARRKTPLTLAKAALSHRLKKDPALEAAGKRVEHMLEEAICTRKVSSATGQVQMLVLVLLVVLMLC